MLILWYAHQSTLIRSHIHTCILIHPSVNLASCYPSDIQECLQPSVCIATQVCEDTPPGSFTCLCPPGSVMSKEGICVGTYRT